MTTGTTQVCVGFSVVTAPIQHSEWLNSVIFPQQFIIFGQQVLMQGYHYDVEKEMALKY